MSATQIETEHLWFLDTLVTLRVCHEDGADGLSVVESLARRGDSPPLHVHHTEDEIFHVVSGELRLRVGDEDVRLDAGGTALAPKGIPHTYRVESEESRWITITAAGEFERFVRAAARPAEAARLPDPAGLPTPQQAEAFAALAREHGIELVGPPLD